MRLAIVYSPITWSRFSIWASSSAIRRSRGSAPFFPPPLASAASPAARNSSRQRYSVGSLTPIRRAIAAASYLRSKLSTASRRSFTSTLHCLAIDSTPRCHGSVDPNLPRKSLTWRFPGTLSYTFATVGLPENRTPCTFNTLEEGPLASQCEKALAQHNSPRTSRRPNLPSSLPEPQKRLKKRVSLQEKSVGLVSV